MRENSVSVIIVNFNGGSLLTECVLSVLNSTLPAQVLVSDNGSSDQSIETLQRSCGSNPRLLIIRNGRNLGFAKANNLVLSRATGDYLLFLNPDCVIRPDTLENMRAVMIANPQVAMAGCLINNPDGTEQAGCRRYIPTPWLSMVRMLGLSRIFKKHPKFSDLILVDQPLPEHPIPIQAISGAFMFVRRSAMEVVGMMDEDYFLHCEDLDWCMRFYNAGYTILFVPSVSIIHAKGGCSSSRPILVEWHKHKGMVRFYRKFFRHQYPTLLMLVVISAVWMRFGGKAAIMTVRRYRNAGLMAPIQPIATGPHDRSEM